MAERTFGPYRLVQQIATGGMAEIHLARARGIGGFEKYVALKMIHPNYSTDEHFIQMLIDEAKISVQLQHVNIAQVFDLGRVGNTYYITMEYVDGCDLFKLLRRSSEQDLYLPIECAAYIAKEVCAGLDYAHRKTDDSGRPLGIIHRDISPQNVLLSHAAEVKLVDFGIAKATMRAKQTAVGVIKGKYYYMSPEQAWGDKLDHRTDIFSTGILLYEMLTAQMLYLEEDLHRLLDRVRKADIAPPSTKRPDVPIELERIVMKALAKRPGDRWQTAEDFRAALERFLHAFAPDFTPSRLSSFMRGVLGEPEPLPRAPSQPAPETDAPARVTQGLARDAILSSRHELIDENSVIFKMDDVTKGIVGPAGRSRATPSRLPNVETPHVALSALDDAPPARLTAPPPSRPVPEDSGDRTVISDPPGFAAAASVSSTLALDEDDLPTGSTRAAPPHRSGLGEVGGHDDEPTRIDLGVPTLPPDREHRGTEPSALGPSPGGRAAASSSAGMSGARRGTERPFDEDAALDAPTHRVRALPLPDDPLTPIPALRASTPRPTVSLLSTPRPSRRTPAGGVPVGMPPRQPAPPPPASIPRAPQDPALPPQDPRRTSRDSAPPPSGPRPAPRESALPPSGPRPAPRESAPPPSGPRPAPRESALPPFAPPASAPRESAPPPSGPRPAPRESAPPPSGPRPAPRESAPLPFAPPASAPAPSAPAAAAGPVGHALANPVVPPGANQPPAAAAADPTPGSPASPGAGQSRSPAAVGGDVAPTPVDGGATFGVGASLPNAPWLPPGWSSGSSPDPTLQAGAPESLEDSSFYKIDQGVSGKRRVLALAGGLSAAGVVAFLAYALFQSPAPTTPAPTTLEVHSLPSGADVYVNGRSAGKTPLLLDVEPGKTYRLRVEHPTHEPWERDEPIAEQGRQVKVIAALKPIVGTLVITSVPSGAEVFLNNQSLGRTPLRRENIDPFAESTVELRLRGHRPERRKLQWDGKRELTLEFTLRPSPK